MQRQQCLAQNGFIRDVDFAKGVRHAIAHLSDGVEPSSAEKTRAAEYLIRAVKLVRRATGKNADAAATQSQVIDEYDAAATQAALTAIHRGRVAIAAFGAVAIFSGAVGLCALAGNDFPPVVILGAGAFSAVSILFGSMGHRALTRSQYYSLPGSRFANGEHRCIFCGLRGKDGRGIYTHGQYKSSTKFHECSKCKKELFIS